MTLNTFNDVSSVLEEELQTLTYLEKLRNRLYTSYYIRKKHGKREINTYIYKVDEDELQESTDLLYSEIVKIRTYSRDLERVHRKIDSRILDTIKLPSCINGFKKGESIKKAVEPHVGKSYVACLDIHNFFPSVTSDAVLEGLKNVGFGSDAAWLIARLVTYKGHLPQGAVTSPKASNIAFMKVDMKILELAQEYGADYTRYADDLIFSANEPLNSLIDKVIAEIENSGYKINREKVKFYGPSEPHYILGMIANHKLNVPREKRRNLEAAIHNYIVKHQVPQDVEDPVRYKKTLLGKAAYMLSVNPSLGRLAKLRKQLQDFNPEGLEYTKIII